MESLTQNEILTLEYLADGKDHMDTPKGLTDNQFYSTLKSLQTKDMVMATFVTGGKVWTSHIKTNGLAALDDLGNEDREYPCNAEITEEKIKVLEFLSDGKEHFNQLDIDDYDEICKNLASKGLVSLGETMDDGIKLTYQGKREYKFMKNYQQQKMNEIDFALFNAILLHRNEIDLNKKNASPQVYDFDELKYYTKQEITQSSLRMKEKGWIDCFVDGGPAYWHVINDAGIVAFRKFYKPNHEQIIQNSNKIRDKKTPQVMFNNMTNKIFIVHGHDSEMKESVARMLERIGLTPIILSEQVDQSRTIIEKFEEESNVGFAVVLMSDKDDHGAEVDSGELKPRARQNVILELGYFIGKLGRRCVCVLQKGSVEVPSDILGVVYKTYDSNNLSWKYSLCDELKAAGYDVDKNKL